MVWSLNELCPGWLDSFLLTSEVTWRWAGFLVEVLSFLHTLKSLNFLRPINFRFCSPFYLKIKIEEDGVRTEMVKRSGYSGDSIQWGVSELWISLSLSTGRISLINLSTEVVVIPVFQKILSNLPVRKNIPQASIKQDSVYFYVFLWTLYLPLLVDLHLLLQNWILLNRNHQFRLRGLLWLSYLFLWLIEVLCPGGFIGSVLRWCLKRWFFWLFWVLFHSSLLGKRLWLVFQGVL